MDFLRYTPELQAQVEKVLDEKGFLVQGATTAQITYSVTLGYVVQIHYAGNLVEEFATAARETAVKYAASGLISFEAND